MSAASGHGGALPSLSCPDCGGRTQPGPAGRYDCLYCGGHFLAAAGEGVSTLAPQRLLGAAAALHRGRHWLEEQEIAPDVPPAGEDVSLLFVPYWRYEALVAGWVLARPETPRRAALAVTREAAAAHDAGLAANDPPARRPRGGEQERLAAYLAAHPAPPDPVAAGATAEAAATDAATLEPRSSAVLQPVAWSGPACDVRDFGLVGVRQLAPPEELAPFDFAAAERCGEICQVTGSAATVRRQAERAIVVRLGGEARLLRRRISFIKERIELVYYPLYRLKYRAQGLYCHLVLDGMRGTPLAGSRPAREESGRLGLLGAIWFWSCLWALHPGAGIGSAPLVWLIDGGRRGALLAPREIALAAQRALRPRPPTAEPF